MTKKEILTAIQKIKDERDDDEMQHVYEDNLRNSFIEFVAERKDKLGQLARLVLSTNKLDFARWCA
jgi:hypothetical protein